MLDVTGHPEVNDLVLASDVAVLDYSSLRFDYAQTGKPMVFLVPDLDSIQCAASCFPSRSRPRALRGDHRRGRGTGCGTSTGSARLGAPAGRVQRGVQPWQDGKAAQRVVDRLRGML